MVVVGVVGPVTLEVVVVTAGAEELIEVVGGATELEVVGGADEEVVTMEDVVVVVGVVDFTVRA